MVPVLATTSVDTVCAPLLVGIVRWVMIFFSSSLGATGTFISAGSCSSCSCSSSISPLSSSPLVTSLVEWNAVSRHHLQLHLPQS
eukprot:5015199-Amphidinium_carterae.3